jgi:radical SAM family uncharacterized protein
MPNELNEVLPLVTKPIRYTGGEYNSLYREPDRSRVSWVLAMPEVYEIGMSNYGLRVLYSVLNRLPDAHCERCYVPWPDFGRELAARSLPLYALESRRPVAEFDVVGVSLQSELSYTNLLYLLDLARIPLDRAGRREGDPLVIAGGPCTVNPLPMERFVDAFVVGDGEDAVRDVNRAVAEWNRQDRQELLERLAKLDGLYVPGVTNRETQVVRRRVVPQLKEEDAPFPPLVPICEITHDRLTLEIARGCTRGCRFCQAGMMNRPVRMRDPDQIVRLAERGIRSSGWEEISLLSLSALDYPGLADLIRQLNARLRERRVSVSLPSTRGEDFTAEMALDLQEVKKSGLTFAPETASPRLRSFVNKNISEVRIMESIRNAIDAGWGGVKLYFMVGLPGETEGDVDETGRFVTEVAKLCRGRMVRFNLTPFVPKPHTPLQWAGFADPAATQAKMDRLRASLTRRNVRPKWEDPEGAVIQALLARGDERLAPVIERVYRAGGVFQEWTEHFSYELWRQALAAEGVDLRTYLEERPVEARLAWDFIDVGVSRQFLADEYARAKAGKETPDCARGACTDCGACPDRRPPAMAKTAAAKEPEFGRRPRPARGFDELKNRFRLKYRVGEQFRFAAHLDRVRALYRSLRRSDLPIVYTKGFAPKPMLSFGPPLPVGVASDGEYVDVFTSYHYSGNISRDLGPFLPKGLKIVAAQPVPRTAVSLGQSVNLGRYLVDGAEPVRPAEVPSIRELRRLDGKKIVFDLAIVPGVKLFDALARLCGLDETAARALSVRRLDCFVDAGIGGQTRAGAADGGLRNGGLRDRPAGAVTENRTVTPLGEPAGPLSGVIPGGQSEAGMEDR